VPNTLRSAPPSTWTLVRRGPRQVRLLDVAERDRARRRRGAGRRDRWLALVVEVRRVADLQRDAPAERPARPRRVDHRVLQREHLGALVERAQVRHAVRRQREVQPVVDLDVAADRDRRGRRRGHGR
jgi:hypothetical protein